MAEDLAASAPRDAEVPYWSTHGTGVHTGQRDLISVVYTLEARLEASLVHIRFTLIRHWERAGQGPKTKTPKKRTPQRRRRLAQA